MEPYQPPSDEEIGAAYAQGKAAVIALFNRTVGELAFRIRALEDRVSNSGQALLDEISHAGEGQPDLSESARLPYPDAKTAAPTGIKQGDIYWVLLAEPSGSEAGWPHPHVVIQDNIFNRSRIHSVVVCALTSNRKRAKAPGNVLLDAGEANLPRQSVVEVSKISTVDKTQLGETIGTLSEHRIQQIWAGMQFYKLLVEPRKG